MATKKSFADYLAEAQAQYGLDTPVAAKPKGNQNFLDWAIDIASRPFRVITNPINQAFNELQKQQKAQKEGKAYDFLGGIGNVSTAGLRGFFSTDIADQPTGSGLIEKGTDTFGGFDPNYVDVQDNVNPVVKGVGGFLIDVGLDPLTYLPIGAVASVARGGITGAKAAIKAGEAGKVLSSAAKAAAVGVPEATKFGRFSKNLKPIGLKQWQELRQYEKFSKAANKAKIVGTAGEEALLAAAKGEQSIAKATEAINAEIAAGRGSRKVTEVTPEQVAKVSAKASKYLPGTEATMQRFATRDIAAAEAAAKANDVSTQIYNDAVKAAPPVPKETQTIVETPDGLVKASDLLAGMANRQTLINITEGALARGKAPAKAAVAREAIPQAEWIAQEIKKAGLNNGYKLAHLAGESDGRPFADGFLTASELKTFAGGIKENTNLARYARTEAKLESAYNKYATDFAANNKAIANQSASRTIMSYLNDPANVEHVKAAMGEDAVRMIGEYGNNTQKGEALKYINDILRGEINPDTITKWGNTKRGKIAEAVFKHNEIDIPGTNARQPQVASEIDSAANAEMAIQAEIGKTLEDMPEFAGMDEETIKNIAAVLHGWFKDEFLSLVGYSKTDIPGLVKNNKDNIAKWYLQYNSMDFMTLHNRFIDARVKEIGDWNKWAKSAGLSAEEIAGDARAKDLYDYVITRMRLANGWLDDKAVFGFLGVGEDAVHLNWDQVLETWNKWQWAGEGTANRSIMYAAIFNEGSAVPMSNLMEAQHFAITNKGMDPKKMAAAIDEILHKEIVGRDGKKLKNVLNETDPTKRIYRHFPDRPADSDWLEASVKNTNPDLPPHKYEKKYWFGSVNPEGFSKQLTRMIMETSDELDNIVKVNNESVLTRWGNEVSTLTDGAFKKLQMSTGSPQDTLDSLKILANTEKYFVKTGKDGKAMPTSVEASSIITRDLVEPVAEQQAKNQTSVEKILKTPVTEGNVQKQVALESEKLIENNLDMAKPEFEANLREGAQLSPDGQGMFGEVGPASRFSENVGRTIFSALARRFSSKTGKEDVIYKYWEGVGTFTPIQAAYKDTLRDIQEIPGALTLIDKKGASVMDDAWSRVRNGNPLDEKTASVGKALEDAANQIFGIPGNREATSMWAGATIDDIIAYTGRAGIDFPAPMDQLLEWQKAEGGSLTAAFLNHWRDWAGTIRNPIDFLERMHYAALSATTHKVMARTFTQIPDSLSIGAKAGFTKVSGFNPEKNPLLAHIPSQATVKGKKVDVYINDILLEQVRNLEHYMAEPRKHTGTLADMVNNTYTPLLGAWKRGVTIMRPGHHTRNHTSEHSVTLMVNGPKNFGKAYRKAAEVFVATRKYDGVQYADWLKAFARGDEVAPMAGKTLLSLERFGDKSINDIAESAFRKGLFNTHVANEDLIEGSGKLQSILDTATLVNTPLGKAAHTASDFVNHQARLTHYIQFIMNNHKKGIYRTWDQLEEAAAEATRKYHPDGSMVTAWEARNMRLLLPFYGWFRKIAPVIFEMAIDQPGRFMMIPKASFNLAVAMGVNPQSLSDPFPQDQLFPKYMTDQLTGPILKINGKYFNIQPGIAAEDIVNQFVGDPVKGVTGMLTPFLKVPAELLTGSQIGTGSKIKDYSDYVDAQLPGLNYLANISGYSVTGSIGALLASGKLDQQYQAWKKNKGAQDQGISFVNWVTGIGLSNMSKPSAINLAEIEKRNAAAASKNTRSSY